MGIRLGIVGVGAFAQGFIPLFNAHPDVDQVVLCDLDAEKRQSNAEKHGIVQTSPSLDDLCDTDVDAIALFTQNWLHGPQAAQALRAGKHVYSAVPPGIALDELRAIAEAVRETGNIYMLGETSYYYPAVIYCRQRFREGAFGDVVYAEAEYYHDWDHGLYAVAKWRGGRKLARNRWCAAHVLSHPFDESDSLYHGRAYDPRFMSGLSQIATKMESTHQISGIIRSAMNLRCSSCPMAAPRASMNFAVLVIRGRCV